MPNANRSTLIITWHQFLQFLEHFLTVQVLGHDIALLILDEIYHLCLVQLDCFAGLTDGSLSTLGNLEAGLGEGFGTEDDYGNGNMEGFGSEDSFEFN